MNRSYKLVFNKKRGEFVVASELAQGAKKSSVKKIMPLAAALLLLPLGQSVMAETIVYLEPKYSAAQLNWIKDEKGNAIVDKDSPIKTDQTKGNLILNEVQDYNISFKQEGKDDPVKVINGMEPNSPYDNLGQTDLDEDKSFEELIDLGIAGIYKKEGEDLIKQDEKSIEWTNASFKDGQFIDAEDSSNGKIGAYKYLDKQPAIPFYQLNMVTAEKGTMNFAEKVEWKFGQAKGSQLFIAKDGANITLKEGADIDVDFGAQLVVNEPKPSNGKEVPLGQTKTWSGLSWSDLAKNEGFGNIYKQNIDDLKEKIASGGYTEQQVADFNEIVDDISTHYNELQGKNIDNAENANIAKDILGLHLQLAGTVLPSFNQTEYEKYLKTLEKLVIVDVTPNYLAVIEKIDFDGTPLYVNDQMTSNPGKNALFKSGENSKVIFNNDSKVKVRNGNVLTAENSDVKVEKGSDLAVDGGDLLNITGDSAKAVIEEGAEVSSQNGYIVRASGGATVTNQTKIELFGSGSGSANAHIDNSSYNQEGSLYFNMNDSGEKKSGAVGETVTGENAKYINTGNIYSTGLGVATGEHHGGTISADKGAEVVNSKNIYIAALATEKNERTDGIFLVGAAGKATSFSNEKDALISVGYDGTGKKVAQLSGTRIDKGYKIKGVAIPDVAVGEVRYRDEYMNNAILVESAGDAIDVKQQGIIKLSDTSVGININGYSEKVNVNNAGEIRIEGDYSAGMRVNGKENSDTIYKDNSNVRHSGKISVEGQKSTGLLISNNAVAEILGGTIHVKGTNEKGISYGVYVDKGQLILKDDGSQKAGITLEGSGVVGARAVNGGAIKLTGVNSVDFEDIVSGKNLTQYWISGKNALRGSSTIDFGTSDVSLTLNEGLLESTLFRVDNGAVFGSKGGVSDNTYTFNVNAVGGVGLDVANAGTEVHADGQFTFNVKGENATGIRVTSNAGRGANTVYLGKDAKISVSGKGATAALIDGRTYTDGVLTGGQTKDTTLVSEAVLCSENSDTCSSVGGNSISGGAYGYKIINQGTLIHKGVTDLTNTKDATAIYINGGTLNNTSSVGVVVGAEGAVGVDVYDAGSVITNLGKITAKDGIAAVRLNDRAGLTVKGSEDAGGGLILGSKTADAIRVNSGAKLALDKAEIKVDGSGSGVNFMTAGDVKGETFTLTGSGEILVAGDSGAAGIRVQGENGSIGDADFDSSKANGLSIIVEEASGNGIITNIKGSVKSGAKVDIRSKDGQSALVVAGNTVEITQSGELRSNSEKAVVDLSQANLGANKQSFTNTGIIHGEDTAVLGHSNATKFVNTGQSAKITGVVELQHGANEIILSDKSKADIISAGHGNNTVLVQSEAGVNEIKLGHGNNVVTLYGGVRADNISSGNGADIFELVNVGGNGDSEKLFQHIDGGGLENKLVLKATASKGGVEVNPASHYVFTDAVLKNIADLEIKAGSRFELANAELVDSAMAKDNYLNIDIVDKGQLDINQSNGKGDYIFNNKLLGSGLVTTNLGNTEHKFQFTDSNTGGDFKGIFAINNGAFEIVNKNAAALKEATLRLDNKTDMGIGVIKKVDSRDERETIKGLIFNGGQLVVEEEITTGKIDSQIDSRLTVGTLDLSKGGSISLSLGKEVNDVFTASTPDTLYSKDLLLQDEGKFTIQLVESMQDVISGGAVVVVDLDGNKIKLGEASKKEIGIYQEDIANPVATGNYGLVTQTNAAGASKEDGLYLSYALDTVTLLGKTDASIGADWYKGALNLQVAEGGSDNAQTFKASISGDGDLVINTNPAKGALKLSGANNDYKGATYVISGDLELLGDKALGKTRLLDIASGSAVTLSKDASSSVGQLQTAQKSELHLGAVGSLTITGKKYDESDSESDIGLDNIIAGSLTGGMGAKLVLEMNKLQVVGANTSYKGDVDVQKSTTLELNHTQGVGSDGQVDLAGTLHLNGVGKGRYQKQIFGVDGSTVLVDNDSTVVFEADHVGISEINIGGASGSDESRVIVVKETHLAGSDKNATAKVDIRKNSTLEFSTNEEHWVVKNEVSGAGNLYKSGAGIIELNEESAKYTGKTTVESGILIAGNTDKALDLQSTEMFIDQSGTFAGFGSINGAVTNKGNFFVGKLVDTPADPHGTIESKYAEKSQVELDETGVDSTEVVENAPTINNKDNVYTIKGNLENSGNIFLSNSFVEDRLETGTNLKVEGNYFANGGAIFMNTTLNAGHEAESTDKLIVSGNVVKKGDATKLYISNAQGNGAYTDEQPDAIEVVHVEGTSYNNAFVLGNRVAIGVYEYNLHKGIGIENAESWFLDSYDKNLNPGIGAFIGNQNAAIGMFSMTLHDRMGNLGYSDPSLITEDDDTLNSAWVRIVAERNKYKAIDKQMSIKSNTYIVHLGADFYKWTDDLGATRRLGVMAGYGHGDIKSRSNTGFNAEGTIEAAYNLGLYGTYYNPNGFYVDAWAQHSWFKNKIALEGDSQTYRSKLLSLSVELGHTFDISEVSDNDKQWRLQPQAQLTWHKYKLNNNVVSGSGLAVTNLPSHTTVARLGVKLIHANVRQEDRKMQPFVEVNWLHSNANKAIEFNNWYETSNNAPKNRYELKVGVEGRYNNRWSMWGNVATQMGKDSYRNYRGTIGAKYDF